MKCRACEIERNDEQVKQMPMHTCGKDGPVEFAQPKTAMTQSDAPQRPQADSPDVRVMKIVAQFDYLVNRNEQLTIDELKNRAQFCPGIMDEPELQELVQIIKHSTISSVYKNSMGIWWNFKSKQL